MEALTEVRFHLVRFAQALRIINRAGERTRCHWSHNESAATWARTCRRSSEM